MRDFPRLVLTLVLGLSVFVPRAGFAAIPLPSSPSWTSIDDDISTGGAFADLNGDGWIDFLISNGNDWATNRNSVYMNNSGALDTVASWRSADGGLYGHCYAGDVNNDGLPDLAVAYLGSGVNGDHLARIYLNSGGALGTTPAWKAADRHSSFDCCLGDVDLDGDLDLAVSAGDVYSSPVEYDRACVYRNNGGVFDTLPCWSAADTNPSDAVRFCDIDNDGDLDLFVGQVIPGGGHGKVTMYRNDGGTLDTVASWTAEEGVGWVLRLAFGDYDADGFLDLAAAYNDQLGEPNGIKVFHNNAGTLDTVASFTMLGTDDFASCVAWGDANGDNYPELAAGRWYGSVYVFENRAGVLDTTPTWSWVPENRTDLVCEAVVWGDVTNGHLSAVNESNSGDGARKLFGIHRKPLQALDSVYVEGAKVPVAGYCYDLLGGWVSLAAAPPSGINNVVFFYRFSEAPDLAVTNWNESNGNHLFLNTTSGGISEFVRTHPAPRLAVWPNPAVGAMKIALAGPAPMTRTMSVYDGAGRLRRVLSGDSGTWTWDGRDEEGRPVEPGVYFAALGQTRTTLKLVRISQN